jgi:DNA-binding MarR family transcriptional regulator
MDTLALEGPAARIARLIERMGRLARARESGGDLNPAQWEAIRYLARANRFSRRPSAVAQWLASGKGTTSQTLMALERKGFLTRQPEGRDKRGTRLDLTERGRALAEQDPLADLSRSIARLPPLHTAALSQSLAHILADLSGPQARSGFETCQTCRHYSVPDSTCLRFRSPLNEDEIGAACAFSEPGS